MQKYKIAQIIQKFLPQVENEGRISAHQRSILKLISVCKTSALGGHKESCDQCNYSRIHFNSCGNRNCPSCQAVNKEKWIHDRKFDLLPVKYFHGVFTVPSELYIYFRYNKKLLYDLLFRSVRETLLTFGFDPIHGIGGKIGAIAVLHTWTQQMTYHPHVHCIIPAGGLTNNKWKHSKSKGNFLFPVRAMSKLFRGKLVAGIHQLYKRNELILSKKMADNYFLVKNTLYKKKWVVYAKKTFGGPDQVLEYLGRYTHKICISNYRIIHISSTLVTFTYLDRVSNQKKTKSIKGQDFVRLFAEHILPKRFVKMRHLGILSARSKKIDLALARKSLGVNPPAPKQKLTTREFIKLTTGKDPYSCPCCFDGEMSIIRIIPSIRGSPNPASLRFFAKDRKIMIK